MEEGVPYQARLDVPRALRNVIARGTNPVRNGPAAWCFDLIGVQITDARIRMKVLVVNSVPWPCGLASHFEVLSSMVALGFIAGGVYIFYPILKARG